MIQRVQDTQGNLHTTTPDILRTFTEFMCNKYAEIITENESIQYLTDVGNKTLPMESKDILDEPITMEELAHAVRKGPTRKAPGSDGISQDFFKISWQTTKHDMLDVVNRMFLEGKLTDRQKHGITVCLPKTTRPTSPNDYRPITLMNADYKLLARVLANRICPWMADLLQPSQYCGIPGNTVFDAVAAVREVAAQAEVTNRPLCIISLDFPGSL
jgi:hypothetical protein